MECRFWIKFKKAHGEKDSADTVNAEQRKSTNMTDLLQKCCADYIYNANEIGLLYRVTPASSPDYQHATLSGSNKTMVCVNVLWYLNISRTHKRKLLVTGERAKPPCFKRINMDGLPFLYYPNKMCD
jgi:hypothetical protein